MGNQSPLSLKNEGCGRDLPRLLWSPEEQDVAHSDPVCAIPPPAQPFVSGPQGSLILQSNLTTFMGMKIELGANPATILEVCALGRFWPRATAPIPIPQKTSHLIRIVDAVRDVDMASVTVSTVPGVSGFFSTQVPILCTPFCRPR
jgi:hypothetical protein